MSLQTAFQSPRWVKRISEHDSSDEHSLEMAPDGFNGGSWQQPRNTSELEEDSKRTDPQLTWWKTKSHILPKVQHLLYTTQKQLFYSSMYDKENYKIFWHHHKIYLHLSSYSNYFISYSEYLFNTLVNTIGQQKTIHMSKMIIVSTTYINISQHTTTILSHPSQYQIHIIRYKYNKISAEQYTNVNSTNDK